MTAGSFKVLSSNTEEFRDHSDAILVDNGRLHEMRVKVRGKFFRRRVPLSRVSLVESLEQTNHSSLIRKALGAAGGAVLLGPVGLIAGALASGNGQKHTLVVTLDDGTALIVRADGVIFRSLLSAALKKRPIRQLAPA